ncbi:endonuclease NucS [Sphingomonas sanguinis]|uniref:endonuclease NucS domain-containing protein n=1 Tax=Sphingomonas sp. LC-1 TaxID=3110957 RepID=UPI0021BB8306|nr:endonuclease NucS domain-containing protein [Sphingomonas sp. LC-1]MCT8003788.1 endonuclease NucS [Sphingomonas sp. LC-1]
MKTMPNEAALRDYLAQHLDMIEPGLTLVDTEFHLANPNGASGFLDIFARAADGQLVIIEIKRTNSAAREAIQELYKYAALLREKYLLKETEYRLILLSVEWHELLVPYSEFVPSAPYEIWAGEIVRGPDGLPVEIKRVEPIALAAHRKLAVRHFLWGFVDDASASAAVPRLAAHIQRTGLTDFVLVQSRPTSPSLEGRAFLYFAQRELRLDEYLALIEAHLDEEAHAEFLAENAGYSELEDRIAEAADMAWLMPQGAPGRHQIGSDTAEIANPEKGARVFANGAQDDIRVHRFGRLDDPMISDETILAEIKGDGGEADFRLRFTARTNSAPLMRALTNRVENIFFYNEAWQGTVLQFIRYAERKPGPATIELIAYSPEDILRAIASSAFGFPGYVPTFRLDIVHDGETERFIGLPEWDGTKPDFAKVIAQHFNGNDFSYFLACHFGKNRTMNRDIMTDLGLRYSVFRDTDAGPERVRVQGSIIVPVKGEIRSINHLINAHVDEVHQIVAPFMRIDQGFAQTIQAFINNDMPLAERRLAELIADAPAQEKISYWMGDLDACDVCEHPFAPLRFMVDGDIGPCWANICARCFNQHGVGLGTGYGQVYESTSEGWLCVAG